MNYLERWRKNASGSDFDDLQEHSDSRLVKMLKAASRAGDNYRAFIIWGILTNRAGLKRDFDK